MLLKRKNCKNSLTVKMGDDPDRKQSKKVTFETFEK